MLKNFLGLKKFFGLLIFCVAILSMNSASARDVYVGTSNVTGRDCYVMTETIQRRSGLEMSYRDCTLKMVRPSDGNVQYLDYTFYCNFGGDDGRGWCFRNSQGFDGRVDRYETPIEWQMWQVIQ